MAAWPRPPRRHSTRTACARLRGVRGAARRQAGRVPRLRIVDPEAAPGARPDARVYEHEYANVHRGVYRLSERATEGFEGARRTVASLLNAPSEREVIFTRSATEAINLVAYAWGLDNLGPGDVVVVTELEHHANFVPWQFIAQRTGASFRHIPIDDDGELQLDALDGLSREGNIKVVANNLVSNSLGTIIPVEALAEWAHAHGAIMVVDAAQAAPHRVVDVQALGVDFVAISSHKLWGRAASARSGGSASSSRRCPR